MIPVTIADVVELRKDVQAAPQHIVVLLDAAGHRALPIWIGPAEAAAIALGQRELSTARPMTFDFMAKMLAATDATVEAVQIAALKGDVYYATVQIGQGEVRREIDARPSDALGLAVRTGSPIYVAEDVLAKAGADLGEDWQQAPLGRGMDAFVARWRAEWEAFQARPRPAPEEMERECRETLALVFGSTPMD